MKNKNFHVVLISFDTKNAFKTVRYEVAINSFQGVGVAPDLINIFNDYFCNRPNFYIFSYSKLTEHCKISVSQGVIASISLCRGVCVPGFFKYFNTSNSK